MSESRRVTDHRIAVYIKLLRAVIRDVEVVSEYRFHPTRLWRFDFAFPSVKVAVEIDGAIWTGGRHVHPSGYLADLEKFNTAASLGWRVLRFSTDDQFSQRSLLLIKETVNYVLEEQKAAQNAQKGV